DDIGYEMDAGVTKCIAPIRRQSLRKGVGKSNGLVDRILDIRRRPAPLRPTDVGVRERRTSGVMSPEPENGPNFRYLPKRLLITPPLGAHSPFEYLLTPLRHRRRDLHARDWHRLPESGAVIASRLFHSSI